MSTEPWSLDYRGLLIVPICLGAADEGGYEASYKVNRALPDGSYETLLRGRCEGRYTSDEAAREAATDAAQVAVEQLLGASA